MRTWAWCALLMTLVTVPAAAQERTIRASVGYALSVYMEQGGGIAPFGLYGSVFSTGKPIGFDADVAYHRDEGLNTVTACAGPRFARSSDGSQPFFHILGGLRYDSFEGGSDTKAGGMAGAGVDWPRGSGGSWRIGMDVQMFFYDSDNLKTLRFTGGFTF